MRRGRFRAVRLVDTLPADVWLAWDMLTGYLLINRAWWERATLPERVGAFRMLTQGGVAPGLAVWGWRVA